MLRHNNAWQTCGRQPREQLVDLLPHRWKPSTVPPVAPADPVANA